MTCSSLIHLWFASRTRASTEMRGSEASTAMPTHSSLSMNSQRPSVATRINLSVAGSSSRSKNSGSLMTPAVWATASPRERDMARPGTSMCPSHTRGGPSIPSSYSTAKTRPPALMMRFFSSGVSGLWSWVNSSATILPLGPSFPMVTRESPMLQPIIVFPRMMAMERVVPLNSVSTREFPRICLSTFRILSLVAFLGSFAQLGWLNISLPSSFLKYWLTPSPASPWPSRTQRTRELVASWSAMMRLSWFFFLGLYGAWPFLDRPEYSVTAQRLSVPLSTVSSSATLKLPIPPSKVFPPPATLNLLRIAPIGLLPSSAFFAPVFLGVSTFGAAK
mmetsp:Transcript_25392/g.47718  ORF Transcript_25392/g.47718 Transcript_25392/m.47718 type:complete len:334 (-) Transcript_25392:48-1049(-)